MFRIDHPTAAGSLPTPLSLGTQGYFTRGNPTTGEGATVPTADWMNMVQESLMGILAAASVGASKTDYNRLRTALTALYGGGGVLLATGWQKLAGGLLMQWTNVSIPTSTNVTWTYPIAFPTALFGVYATAYGAVQTEKVSVITASTTAAVIDNDPGSTLNTAYVLALGA